MAREVESTEPEDPAQLLILAETYALIGRQDMAIQALERAFEAGFDDPYYILIDPPLGGLQNEPAIDRLAPNS